MRLRSLGFQLIAVSFLAVPAGAATVVAVGDGATLQVWGCPNSMDSSHATIGINLARRAWRSSNSIGVK
jgi:hypothetical protein